MLTRLAICLRLNRLEALRQKRNPLYLRSLLRLRRDRLSRPRRLRLRRVLSTEQIPRHLQLPREQTQKTNGNRATSPRLPVFPAKPPGYAQ